MRFQSIFQSSLRVVPAVMSAILLPGCAVVERVGVAALYRKASLPDDHLLRNQAYGPDARQVLNLFLPVEAGSRAEPGWPVVIFVHGGSWNSGDKDLTVGGADVYGNIARYLATQGIGAAVISYRLQPQVTLQEQVEDVARAAGWIHRHIASQGGRADRIFLYGHSAGAQLAAYTAFNSPLLTAAGVPPECIRGVIPVSGAGLDLTDQETYRLGHSVEYYHRTFRMGGDPAAWQHDGSATSFIRPGSPPCLVIVGAQEERPMIRQSVRLDEVLTAKGVPHQFLSIPGQNHLRIVLALSRPDKIAGPAVVDFIRRYQ